jgi:hypothetical protein
LKGLIVYPMDQSSRRMVLPVIDAPDGLAAHTFRSPSIQAARRNIDGYQRGEDVSRNRQDG